VIQEFRQYNYRKIQQRIMLVTQSCRCCGSHLGYSSRFAYAWTL